MNHNQRLVYDYARQCHRNYDSIVYFIDKLFENEIKWLETNDDFFNSFLMGVHNSPTWGAQINRVTIEPYVNIYCEPQYYGSIMSEKIRQYKLNKRRDK